MTLNQIEKDFSAAIENVKNLEDLENVRLKFMGKSGHFSLLMRGLGNLSPEGRSQQGALFNEFKKKLVTQLENKKGYLEEIFLKEQLEKEAVDISLPCCPEEHGKIHPISKTIESLAAFFLEQGFSFETGPHIETPFHNFTALNIPEDHPSRQEHDTFYLNHLANGERSLLRTHTSPVQIRTMLRQKPPLRIVALGKVFRSDYDLTHTPMFHQLEGLVIDKNIHMGHLKHTVMNFLRNYFENPDLKVRFRPSFFPFTEPSAEVDILWTIKKKGGKVQKWLEMGGCGMVNPQVLRNCALDPNNYKGFAFGFGVERLSMIKYQIQDLRSFFESDTRWLAYYGFQPFHIPSILLKESARYEDSL